MSTDIDIIPTDPVWLRRLVTSHGGPQPFSLLHWIPLFTFIFLSCVLIAITPPTRGWKLVRAASIPFLLVLQAYACLFTLDSSYAGQWVNMSGQALFTVKALEVLLFYPPEEHCHRILPKAKGDEAIIGREVEKEMQVVMEVEAEPIPLPKTMAKFYWAVNVWFSQRGIGWNYSAPLPASSREHPFTRTSDRAPFFLNRIMHLIGSYAISDMARSYMTFGPGAAFFSGRPGIAPLYDSLTTFERAAYSVPIAIYVFWTVDSFYTSASLFMVSVGGWTGWEGEWWSPWGWPPLFGSMTNLWLHPGLSHMWSKTWQQYFRHWLYLFGWLGIGENILRLPHSGRAVPHTPPTEYNPKTTTGSSTQSESATPSPRSASPSHPIPSSASAQQSTSAKLMASNFLKSLIVFSLTGLYHDLPTYLLILQTSPPHSPIPLSDNFPTTTFFILQPFGLAVEAFVKRKWRALRRRHIGNRAKGGGEPVWLITVERTLGFVWTWWWLGYTARYFVVGLTRAGLWMRKEGQPEIFSPFGGLVYGHWVH